MSERNHPDARSLANGRNRPNGEARDRDAAPVPPAAYSGAGSPAWVLDARDLSHRPGASRSVVLTVTTDEAIGVPEVIEVPSGAAVELDVLLESVVEGVLVSGDAAVEATAACSRCLDPVTHPVQVSVTELFAYPESTTEATTEEDEVSHLVDDQVNLEPLVRDAIVLALPLVPLCSQECAGLCAGCGMKWAELDDDHEHETIDPRWAGLVERLAEMSPRESPGEDPGADSRGDRADNA